MVDGRFGKLTSFDQAGNIVDRYDVHSRKGTLFAEASMGHFEMIDLISVINACTTGRAAGRLVSMAKAVEELRVLTGDFISPDEIVANALSPVAWERGCAVLFDEQPGADILHTPWQEA